MARVTAESGLIKDQERLEKGGICVGAEPVSNAMDGEKPIASDSRMFEYPGRVSIADGLWNELEIAGCREVDGSPLARLTGRGFEAHSRGSLWRLGSIDASSLSLFASLARRVSFEQAGRTILGVSFAVGVSAVLKAESRIELETRRGLAGPFSGQSRGSLQRETGRTATSAGLWSKSLGCCCSVQGLFNLENGGVPCRNRGWCRGWMRTEDAMWPSSRKEGCIDVSRLTRCSDPPSPQQTAQGGRN